MRCPSGRLAFHDARLTAKIARAIEHGGLPLAQRPHHLEALDRGIGRLHRLEPTPRTDELLELAVIRLDDVVQVFDLAMGVFLEHWPSAFNSAMALA